MDVTKSDFSEALSSFIRKYFNEKPLVVIYNAALIITDINQDN